MSLLSRRRKKKVVLFLCTGDTCRGPMAQGYMKFRMQEIGMNGVEVRTAGVMTISGLIPQQEAVQVMDAAGVDIRGHRSTNLTPELIRRCDIILGMTPFHVQHAMRESEDARDKTFLLKEFAESDLKNYQISDPMGATLEVYKRVFREMKLAIDKMLESKEFFTSIMEAEKAEAKAAKKAEQEAAAAAAAAEKEKAEKEAAAAKKKKSTSSSSRRKTSSSSTGAKKKASSTTKSKSTTTKAKSTTAKKSSSSASKAKPKTTKSSSTTKKKKTTTSKAK